MSLREAILQSLSIEPLFRFVMPGLVPGIHVFTAGPRRKTWMAGTSPAMTV
jgi:hypothetical protein